MTVEARDRAKKKGAADKAGLEADAELSVEAFCTCGMVRRAARRLTQSYDQALRPLGLRITQYAVLAHVEEAGGMSVTDLAVTLAMERTTLTRNLRPLQRAGWIRIEPGPDKRSRAVQITDEGRRLYREAEPVWRKAEQDFRRRIGGEEAAALRKLLRQAVTSVQA